MLIETAKAGVSLITLDQKACDLIQQKQATCSFYQHEGFPGHICISVNEQLIHGIPTDYKLKDGDLVSFDVGVTYEKHICDAAFAIIIGHNEKAEHILQAANESLMNAIKLAKPGNYIGDISAAIEQTAQAHGYEVIKDFGGHGCGIKLHEDPIILNYGEPHTGTRLIKNMTLCVEPMLMTDSDRYIIDSKNK
jgi:methionyl aminopeptidase